ncbi:hypothetical protein WN943_018502 [Citrus x changshan-huyou]
MKLVQQAGLYLNLTIGPYDCGKWNFVGPVLLKYIPGGLQKKGAPILRANGQDAVPTSSTYGFVSYFIEEVKRLRSENSDLSVTLGLRKHIGKTYKELPPEQKARYKKRDERMGNSGNSNSHSGDNEIVETKCVPERFCALVKSLSEEKKKAIREIGFESLLELRLAS